MHARQQSWPREWLMTDERMGDRLWEAIERLPQGAGVVFRHYSHPQREELGHRVAAIAGARGLTLAVAGDVGLARRFGAQLVHKPQSDTNGLPFSRAVHTAEEAEAARALGAALVFVSPVHETRSHPGRKPLGPELAIEIARAAGIPAIALGGMNAQNFTPLEREGFYGWAGIDAWM